MLVDHQHRRGPAALALAGAVLLAGCGGATGQGQGTAREPAVEREAVEPRAHVGEVPERGTEPAVGRHDPPEAPATVEVSREELDWEDRDIRVGDLDYRVTRVPTGFDLTGDTPHDAGQGRSGWTLDFDATDEGTEANGGHAYFDVQVVQTDDVRRAQQLQERLAGREPVRSEDVRGRPGLAYRSGEQRTVRVLRRTGTLILVRGVGLSRDALLEVAAGVRRSG